MKYPEHILVKFPAGTKERLKACDGSMQDFIRGAVEAALGGKISHEDKLRIVSAPAGVSVSLPKSSDRPAVQTPPARKNWRKNLVPESELSSNGKILLEAVRKRGIVSRREVKRDFGWDDGALLKASLEVRGQVSMDTEKFWV